MPKALLIEPHAREIVEIEHSTYGDLLPYLPGGITVGWTFPSGDVMYVDDEALLHPPTCAFRMRERIDGQPYMSRGVVVGRDDWDSIKNRETVTDVEVTIAEVTSMIEWLTVQEGINWFYTQRNRPAVTITSDGRRETLATWDRFLKAMKGE